jgi:hypothetical protein
MARSPQDLAGVLKFEASTLAQAADIPASNDGQPQRDAYARFILRRISRLAESCAVLSQVEHLDAAQILMRSVLEDFIRLLWAMESEDNAEQLNESGMTQLKLMLKANLEAGTATVKDELGADLGKEVLASGLLKSRFKKKRIEEMAKEAGADGVYNILYRFLSTSAHGNPVQPDVVRGEDDVVAVMSAFGAIGKAAGHAAILWIKHRQQADRAVLLQILGVR